MSNHYRTLGVDPHADPATIRSAYLALIRRLHPDRGGAEADAERAQAVTAAWEVLRDPGRRAAYDDTRRARFMPDGRGNGPAVFGHGSLVRGGAVGRNLFLLLAVATVGLGWWALQQPRLVPPVPVAAIDAPAMTASAPEVAIRPVEDQRAMQRHLEEIDQPPPVPVRQVDETVVVDEERRKLTESVAPRQARDAEAPKRPSSVKAAKPVAVAAKTASIDLAPLERHLELLTDQSYRFGTEAKRARLTASREPFLTRLRACDSDACRRDAYLRRNAEIGEIMRN